jgi:hypothetical protein
MDLNLTKKKLGKTYTYCPLIFIEAIEIIKRPLSFIHEGG